MKTEIVFAMYVELGSASGITEWILSGDDILTYYRYYDEDFEPDYIDDMEKDVYGFIQGNLDALKDYDNALILFAKHGISLYRRVVT